MVTPLVHHLLPEKYWRLGRPKSQSGRLGDEKKSFFLPGFEPRTVQPVTQSLNRLPVQVTVLSKRNTTIRPKNNKILFQRKILGFHVSEYSDDGIVVKPCSLVYTIDSEKLAVTVYRLQTLARI